MIEAGDPVFRNLFTIPGFLALLAVLPALLMRAEDTGEWEEDFL